MGSLAEQAMLASVACQRSSAAAHVTAAAAVDLDLDHVARADIASQISNALDRGGDGVAVVGQDLISRHPTTPEEDPST